MNLGANGFGMKHIDASPEQEASRHFVGAAPKTPKHLGSVPVILGLA
jgi:hypothetical protein